MGTVRIVHLSDLHFVPGKNAQVWELVRDFVNDTVKPHAILVTGDVTDSAAWPEFELAQQSLNSLRVEPGGDSQKFRIVAGNHDRFLYRGNGPPPGLGWLSRRHWPRDKSARFDKAFPGALQVTPRTHCDMLLCASTANRAPVDWRIRIIGFDSSAHTQWFSQGAVGSADIGMAAKSAANATEHDLVIALVHHHILPIPAVERRKLADGGLMKLLDATGLLNAGALMEALSRTQVDLVLHGHEHAEHQARFTGSDELATSVALLSAGSATGDATLKGWDLHRVHFNVIELDDDRSVWLRQVDGRTGELRFQPRRKPLLDAGDIRVSRFVRRNRPLADADPKSTTQLPRSRLRKLVEFRMNRDIQLTECRTEWQVNSRWTTVTTSGSGSAGSAIVEFDWSDGENRAFPVQGEPIGNDPSRIQFSLELPNSSGARLARRVTTRWAWTGAAAFTEAELTMLPSTAKAGPRSRGEEFASVRCTDEFEELLLSVRMPWQFSPRPESVRVYYEKPESSAQTYADELHSGLDFCGPGNFELRIPYPLPGYRYGISWPVSQRPMRSPLAGAFEQRLLQERADAAAVITGQLQQKGWHATCQWAVYLPDGPAVTRISACMSQGAHPQQILLSDARSVARAAFWGDGIVATPNGNHNRYEILPGECIVGYFALRMRRELTHHALGILRLAFIADPIMDTDEANWVGEFKSFANLMALTLGGLAMARPAPTLL